MQSSVKKYFWAIPALFILVVLAFPFVSNLPPTTKTWVKYRYNKEDGLYTYNFSTVYGKTSFVTSIHQNYTECKVGKRVVWQNDISFTNPSPDKSMAISTRGHKVFVISLIDGSVLYPLPGNQTSNGPEWVQDPKGNLLIYKGDQKKLGPFGQEIYPEVRINSKTGEVTKSSVTINSFNW